MVPLVILRCEGAKYLSELGFLLDEGIYLNLRVYPPGVANMRVP